MAAKVWICSRLKKAAPGIYVSPDMHWLLVILDAGIPISEVVETALRSSRLVSELLVVRFEHGTHLIYGPRARHRDEEWSEIAAVALECTTDTRCTASMFTYTYANEPTRRAVLAEASRSIADVLQDRAPEDVEERHSVIRAGGWTFLDDLEKGIAKILADMWAE